MPRQPQFKDTGKRSLFGYFYQPILERNPDHFLIALDNLFDWDSYSDKLLMLYKGRGIEGRPPYDPALILKMLFISYLYNI